MIETHEDVFKQKHLAESGPDGQEQEVWHLVAGDGKTGSMDADGGRSRTGDPAAAVYLCYWRIVDGRTPGIGKMLGYAYTLHDTTFETNWEIISAK